MRLLVINAVGEPATADLRRRHPGKVLQRPLIGDAPLAGRRVMPQDLLSAAVVDRLEYLASIGNIRVVEMGARTRQVDFDDLRRRLGFKVTTFKVEISEAAFQVLLRDTASTVMRGLPGDVVMMDEANAFPGQPAFEVVVAEPAATLETWAPVEVYLREDAEAVLSSQPGESVNETMAKARAYVEALSPEDRAGSLSKAEDDRLGWWVSTDYGQMFVEAPSAMTAPSADAVLEELGSPTPEPEPEVATPEAWVAPEDLATLVRSSKNVPLASALAIFGGTGAGKNKLKLSAETEAFFAAPDVDPANKFKALELLRAAQES